MNLKKRIRARRKAKRYFCLGFEYPGRSYGIEHFAETVVTKARLRDTSISGNESGSSFKYHRLKIGLVWPRQRVKNWNVYTSTWATKRNPERHLLLKLNKLILTNAE
jgi:hypothetical protein